MISGIRLLAAISSFGYVVCKDGLFSLEREAIDEPFYDRCLFLSQPTHGQHEFSAIDLISAFAATLNPHCLESNIWSMSRLSDDKTASKLKKGSIMTSTGRWKQVPKDLVIRSNVSGILDFDPLELSMTPVVEGPLPLVLPDNAEGLGKIRARLSQLKSLARRLLPKLRAEHNSLATQEILLKYVKYAERFIKADSAEGWSMALLGADTLRAQLAQLPREIESFSLLSFLDSVGEKIVRGPNNITFPELEIVMDSTTEEERIIQAKIKEFVSQSFLSGARLEQAIPEIVKGNVVCEESLKELQTWVDTANKNALDKLEEEVHKGVVDLPVNYGDLALIHGSYVVTVNGWGNIRTTYLCSELKPEHFIEASVSFKNLGAGCLFQIPLQVLRMTLEKRPKIISEVPKEVWATMDPAFVHVVVETGGLTHLKRVNVFSSLGMGNEYDSCAGLYTEDPANLDNLLKYEFLSDINPRCLARSPVWLEIALHVGIRGSPELLAHIPSRRFTPNVFNQFRGGVFSADQLAKACSRTKGDLCSYLDEDQVAAMPALVANLSCVFKYPSLFAFAENAKVIEVIRKRPQLIRIASDPSAAASAIFLRLDAESMSETLNKVPGACEYLNTEELDEAQLAASLGSCSIIPDIIKLLPHISRSAVCCSFLKRSHLIELGVNRQAARQFVSDISDACLATIPSKVLGEFITIGGISASPQPQDQLELDAAQEQFDSIPSSQSDEEKQLDTVIRRITAANPDKIASLDSDILSHLLPALPKQQRKRITIAAAASTATIK